MNASGQHWPFSRHLEVLGQDRKWCEMIDPPIVLSPQGKANCIGKSYRSVYRSRWCQKPRLT